MNCSQQAPLLVIFPVLLLLSLRIWSSLVKVRTTSFGYEVRKWEDGTSWGHLTWSPGKTQRCPEEQQLPSSGQRPQHDAKMRPLERKKPMHPFVDVPAVEPGKL